MKLLNQVLKKLHLNNLAVPNRVIFLKLRPFVKWHNTELTNAFCFTSRLMCSAHFTLSDVVLRTLPSSNNFVQFMCAEIPESLLWESCLDPLCVGCFSSNCNSSTHLDSGLLISGNLLSFSGSSCTLFLVFVYCFVHKNAFKGAQFSRYILSFDSFP